MKTIKLKIMNPIDLDYELRTYNSVVHFAYNRFHDDNSVKEKDVRSQVNQLFKGKLNSWLLQCAIKEGKSIQERNESKKVIFGGKSLYKRYLRKLINKEEFDKQRQLPISSQGEMLQKGNRMFDFHFYNQSLVFKISKDKHINIQLGHIHRNLQKELNKLNELCYNKKATVSIKLNNDYIWITYDEKLLCDSVKFNGLKDNRVMGLDMNPNYIGLSIIEFDKEDKFEVLHKQVFDLKELTDKNTSTNKRQYEIIKICHTISNLINYWKCKRLSIEDLNIKSSDKGQGKNFNRLCNNVWDRSLIFNKLLMLSNIYGYELVEVNPVYSSFIGNLVYGDDTTPDMVAASIEIARRGYKKYEKNWFYPIFDIDCLDERWKQTLTGVRNWKDAFLKIKNSKVKYRVLLNDIVQNAVFSKYNRKSKVVIYSFV